VLALPGARGTVIHHAFAHEIDIGVVVIGFKAGEPPHAGGRVEWPERE
jgi:hypothetical protein